MRTYKVVVWGTGMVGQYALRYLLPRPEVELVGVKCFHEAKVGNDAAKLADGDHAATGIKATNDREAILALDADVCIFVPFDALTDPSVEGTPSSAWVPDLLDLLRSGKNVVTSILSIAHWRHLKNGEALHAKVEAACREGNSSLFVAGIDPGFVPDTLGFIASSIVSEVTSIDTWEVLDYGSYEILPALRMLGFGSRPEEMGAGGIETLRTCWGGCPHIMADAFGVTLDDVRAEVEVALAKEAYVADNGLDIPQGSIEAIKFRIAGSRDGKDLFAVNHVTRMGQQSGPDFYRIGDDGGYGIDIKGFPPVKADFPFGLEGGTGFGWKDAMVMTSSRLVNGIESVTLAEPGWRMFFEMPRLGGRFALKDA